ncbi:MAG TPA: hypothetical protein VFQ34_07440 [Nitrospiraceae bacterium]|jgi:DNA-binding response OmpR family regulator|nr:hypothetical protein [Nitrospiraceae bacterium]
MIVDPEWHVGLMLADCLASSGYHAVLGRNLESMLHDLREMQPTAIVLNAHPRQSGQSSLEAVKACCPNAPVISLGQPDHAVGEPTLCTGGSRAERTYVTPHHIEELLQTKFGIPCARLG